MKITSVNKFMNIFVYLDTEYNEKITLQASEILNHMFHLFQVNIFLNKTEAYD